MLVDLSICDLALIERAELDFGLGLNVITGETGAGKSLLIDALELLRGQRARSGMVRAGSETAPSTSATRSIRWKDRIVSNRGIATI